jgi:hypothetical protein
MALPGRFVPAEELKQIFAKLFEIITFEKEQTTPPSVEQIVTEETPESLQGKWDIIKQKRFDEISIFLVQLCIDLKRNNIKKPKANHFMFFVKNCSGVCDMIMLF